MTARYDPTLMRALFITIVCLALARTASAADPTLFRLYLTDGTTIVTYGEYVQVEDRVVFSMLMGGTPGEPRLQTVTLPASLIDWTRTGRDAGSVRYQHYAKTRGEDDFLQLTSDVAGVLNEMLATPDRSRALEIAQRARATLADWPSAHFGYRQRDVQEILAVLDESISGLRAAAGIAAFDVALVAPMPEVELVPLPAPPSLYEQIAQAFRVAGLTGRAAERVALLQATLLMLGEAGDGLPAGDLAIWRRTAETQLRQELAIDARYAALARRLMGDARRAAAAARVADVERVLNRLHPEDQQLGGQRPDVVLALRASIEAHLSAARELRLLRDRWEIRRALYRDYQRMVGSYLRRLVRAESALEAIRRLEGPSPDALGDLRTRLRGGIARLEDMRPPTDLRPAHDTLISAWRFAESAISRRLAAAASADLASAWEASSSAAGALLLLSRAQQEIRAFVEPPRF
jgi:hypothetical protein